MSIGSYDFLFEQNADFKAKLSKAEADTKEEAIKAWNTREGA